MARVIHFVDAAAPIQAVRRFMASSASNPRTTAEISCNEHSGQYMLAVLLSSYRIRAVSFHRGEVYCSIDLEAAVLTRDQTVKRGGHGLRQ